MITDSNIKLACQQNTMQQSSKYKTRRKASSKGTLLNSSERIISYSSHRSTL